MTALHSLGLQLQCSHSAVAVQAISDYRGPRRPAIRIVNTNILLAMQLVTAVVQSSSSATVLLSLLICFLLLLFSALQYTSFVAFVSLVISFFLLFTPQKKINHIRAFSPSTIDFGFRSYIRNYGIRLPALLTSDAVVLRARPVCHDGHPKEDSYCSFSHIFYGIHYLFRQTSSFEVS